MAGRPHKTAASRAEPRNSGERKFVFVITGAFLGLMLALSGMQAQDMMTKSRSREEMGVTLEQVGKHQDDFRIIYGRYATWPQLEERGERLEEGVRVVRSSATESHWYLQLFDPDSGLVCDRIHEMSSGGIEPNREQCREAFTD